MQWLWVLAKSFCKDQKSGTMWWQIVGPCLKVREAHVLGTWCAFVTWIQEPTLIPDAVLRLEHTACAGSSVYSKQQNLGK